MKLKHLTAIALISAALGLTARAVPQTTNFADYPDAPVGFGSVDLDTVVANSWFLSHYGITFSNAYLYADSRDTFDGLGVANDTDLLPGQPATIFFADGTNYVSVDWVTLTSHVVISAFDINGILLDTFEQTGGSAGSITLYGADIRSLQWHNGGGQVGLSTLSYDFDGVTDGTNNDVPDSGATVALLGLALTGLAVFRRKVA